MKQNGLDDVFVTSHRTQLKALGDVVDEFKKLIIIDRYLPIIIIIVSLRRVFNVKIN